MGLRLSYLNKDLEATPSDFCVENVVFLSPNSLTS